MTAMEDGLTAAFLTAPEAAERSNGVVWLSWAASALKTFGRAASVWSAGGASRLGRRVRAFGLGRRALRSHSAQESSDGWSLQQTTSLLFFVGRSPGPWPVSTAQPCQGRP